MSAPTHATAIAYRADIDGLRAVAIVPVLLYHAEIAPFGGGFVGVDVFFVISGYLITSYILDQLDRGRFSLRDFYLRRIRRIFPALFVMMAACTAVGWFILTPNDYRSLGESIVATVLFSSNILFWRQAGYFAQPVEAWPLLHTWSLGVEEQFYLFFPVLIALAWRVAPRRIAPVTAAMCIISFGLNLATVGTAPRFAFYMAPPRIWELFLGALLAMAPARHRAHPQLRQLAGLVGTGLIALAVFGFSRETPFPGLAALLPTVGAAAIIWAGSGDGHGGIVTAMLSWRIPVFVGKISYSLYLWHLPLLAFAAYVGGGTVSLNAAWALLALSALLSVISWLTVEQPVRRGRSIFGDARIVFRAATAAAMLFGGFGVLATATGGFPARIGVPGLRLLAGENDINPDRSHCLPLAQAAGNVRPPGCRFGAADAAIGYALWGDSHGESLRAGFDDAGKRTGRGGIFIGYAGCIPELGYDRSNPGCSSGNQTIADYLAATPSIHTVVLAGRWGLWAEGWPYGAEGGPRVTTMTAAGAPIDNHAALAVGLDAAMAALHAAGKQIWLVGPIPEIGYSVPRTLYLNSLGIRPSLDIRPTIAQFERRQDFVLRLLVRLADKYQARLIWPHRTLCDDRFCHVLNDGRPLYSDDQHLARSGARTLSTLFEPVFAVASPGQGKVSGAP
jgi:peptidoglycan/LPS O-acetylase OafA/YrhL